MQGNEDKVATTEPGQANAEQGDTEAVLAEAFIDRNFQEEMEYLATQKLDRDKEPDVRESHFFKTTTREKHDNVFKKETGGSNIAPGAYHPDEWQLKPG